MAQALQLAQRGRYTTHPNPLVGCVIVRDECIIAEGWHQQAGLAHAEINALQVVAGQARDATVYVTLEPCSHHGRTGPCADALIEAGVSRVVVAMMDPNPRVAGQGLARLQAAGIAVQVGVMEAEAQALNIGFITRMQLQRPWVRCKIAMSLDGRTAMASGESQWISSPAARQDVQRLRASSSAVMTGIGTVVADDPQLTVRQEVMAAEDLELYGSQKIRQPLRVIVDSRGRLPANARLLQQAGPVLLVTAGAEYRDDQSTHTADLSVLPLATQTAQVSLTVLMQELAQRQINSVLLEAGATLNGAMLSAGLIDELILYVAPRLMGDNARGLFHLPWLNEMARSIDLEIIDIRAVACDWRITARVHGGNPGRD